jgi:dipeptidyl aminopeptidase/acylaminoacyl peptidase
MEFQKANHQDLGGGDLQDEVYAIKLLLDTGYVDAKIGITGGSHGGFMTLMAIGTTPDVWEAAVEMYGIIDWQTMLRHEDRSLQQYGEVAAGRSCQRQSSVRSDFADQVHPQRKSAVAHFAGRERHPRTKRRGGAGV